MKQYYTIGEFADLFGLNVQTLYYYDKIGLFCPKQRDEETNRRYYAFDQVYNLASIKFMRHLGYTIDQIKGFFANEDLGQSLQSLREHSQEMKEQWETILNIDNVIQRKLLFIEDKMKSLDVDSMKVKWFGERRFYPIGSEETLYYHDIFYYYPTVVFYSDHGNRKEFGAYIDDAFNGLESDKMQFDPEKAMVIPSGYYLCGYHQGPYEAIMSTAEKMRETHPELELEDLTVNFNVLDQFVLRDSENYVTEVQIPLKGKPKD